jgi:hypothetical protein
MMKVITEITGIVLITLGIIAVICGIVIGVGYGYILVGITADVLGSILLPRTINTYSIIAGGKVMIQGFLIMGAGEIILLVKDYFKHRMELAESED